MGGCSAFGCTNNSRKGKRMVKFPRNEERRRIWKIKCRRTNWEPGPGSQLCLDHFDESQFESQCIERKKLRKTAVPTLFNFTDSPISIITGKKMKGPNTHQEKIVPTTDEELLKKIEVLEKEKKILQREIKDLKEQISEKDSKLSSFLCSEQIAALGVDKYSVSMWSDEAIIKALEMRFTLGKLRYNYLRSTGYPLPSWSTLNRRIINISTEPIKHNDDVETDVTSNVLHEDQESLETSFSD